MTLKYKLIVSVISLVVAFVFGMFIGKNNSKSVAQVQTDTQKNENKNIHKVEVITKSPTGVVTETITTDTADEVQVQKESTSKTTTVTTPSSKLNLSILAAASIHTPGTMVYGLSANKEFIGPITVGVFGLTNGTIGVSMGINF